MRQWPAIYHCSSWLTQCASLILEAIEHSILQAGVCHLMLAGGSTPQALYRHWGTQVNFPHSRLHYYFGDERAVPPDHPESNYGQALQALFPGGLPQALKIERMPAEQTPLDQAAWAYESRLPPQIDVLLLGMGEDGHIASLFPGHPALDELERRVVVAESPKPPYARLTITPRVIAEARHVFLLVTGANKGKKLTEVFAPEATSFRLPVCQVLQAVWLLDETAAEALQSQAKIRHLKIPMTILS